MGWSKVYQSNHKRQKKTSKQRLRVQAQSSLKKVIKIQPKWFCDYGHDLIGQIIGQPMISSNHYLIKNILHTIDATSLLIWCCIEPTFLKRIIIVPKIDSSNALSGRIMTSVVKSLTLQQHWIVYWPYRFRKLFISEYVKPLILY